MHKRVFLKILFLMVGTTLFGCSTVNLSRQDLNSIESISVNPEIAMPKQAVFLGRASNLKNMGFMGAAISEVDRPDDLIVTDFLIKEKIDVREILYSQFSSDLRKTILFPKLKSNGTHKVQLKIELFGLGKGWGFENNMKPSITLLATMTDPQGKVIWSNTELVGGETSELPSRTLEEWMKDPAALKNGFEQASKILVSLILKDFMIR